MQSCISNGRAAIIPIVVKTIQQQQELDNNFNKTVDVLITTVFLKCNFVTVQIRVTNVLITKLAFELFISSKFGAKHTPEIH